MRGRELAAIVSLSLASSGVAAACAGRAPEAIRAGTVRCTPTAALPAPDTIGRVTLEGALEARRSVRTFGAAPLALAEIGQLFWAAQGVTSADGKRTAPSAGGLYPLEIYALTDDGRYHYVPDGHSVERCDAPPWRDRLQRAAYDQDVVGRAPALFVVTGVLARTRAKYGARAEAFVDREAGHATQNVLLEAVALGLAAVPVGGFDASSVALALTLPPGEVPLYLVPVGHAG